MGESIVVNELGNLLQSVREQNMQERQNNPDKPAKLILSNTDKEGLQIGIKRNGMKYSVREHRMVYFMPDIWIKVYDLLKRRARFTAQLLIQTGARINEVRYIKKNDLDFTRRTLTLRITKTKARKGERKGKPRTIPLSTQFTKELIKYFKDKDEVSILSTCAFNIALKKAIQQVDDPRHPYYMLSAHNIRKTHGNWLKIMGNLKIMNIDATEMCLRLGHDYNTFLRDYGSSGVLDSRDIILIQKILGDLYAR